MTTITEGRDDLDQAVRGIARRMREEDSSVGLWQIAAVARILLSPRPEWAPPVVSLGDDGRPDVPRPPLRRNHPRLRWLEPTQPDTGTDPTRLAPTEVPGRPRSRTAVIAQARAMALEGLGVSAEEAVTAWILEVDVRDYIAARLAGACHAEIIRRQQQGEQQHG